LSRNLYYSYKSNPIYSFVHILKSKKSQSEIDDYEPEAAVARFVGDLARYGESQRAEFRRATERDARRERREELKANKPRSR